MMTERLLDAICEMVKGHLVAGRKEEAVALVGKVKQAIREHVRRRRRFDRRQHLLASLKMWN
jgi:hypothetical protein